MEIIEDAMIDEKLEEIVSHLIRDIETGKSLEALRVSDELFESFYAYAYNYYQNGKYSQAKSLFQFLTFFDVKNSKYWMGLGAASQMLKNYSEAIYAYKVAMVANPADPHSYFLIADCHIAENKIESALEVLTEIERLFGSEDKYKKLISHVALIRQTWENQLLKKTNSGETNG